MNQKALEAQGHMLGSELTELMSRWVAIGVPLNVVTTGIITSVVGMYFKILQDEEEVRNILSEQCNVALQAMRKHEAKKGN